MRLLIITQKLDKNDDILGFFHRWVEEFSKQASKVFVVAQYVGQYDLPKNVKVFSLGKEKKYSKPRQFFYFYKLIFKNLSKTDKVFVHMIPMWVVLGWPIFRIYRKKVYLWYTHKSVDFWLKLAEKFVCKIFTASTKSCRLKSDKIIITGHGIDINKFQIRNSKHEIRNKFKIQNSKFKILTAGRMAPVKNLDVLIKTGEILRTENVDFQIQIAGAPILEKDKVYFEKLKNLVKEKNLEDKVLFIGPVSYNEIEKFYQGGDLFINLSSTGSIDKAVLEAMACGLDVLVSNEAFFEILPKRNVIIETDIKLIVDKIKYFIENPDKERSLSMRKIVVENHNLENLIRRVMKCLKKER